MQRKLSDAIHKYNEESRLESLKQQKRYWSDKDEYFGPKHPLKTKYRNLNSQAIKLFL